MAEQGKLEAQIEVRDEPAFTVAYVRHTGPYQGDGELFGKLFGRLMQWQDRAGCWDRRRRWSPSTTTTPA